jgi:hypothetical protein
MKTIFLKMDLLQKVQEVFIYPTIQIKAYQGSYDYRFKV